MRPIFSFGKDIGIDLGTANTLVFMRGQGIILREPSVVAVDTRTDTVRYVGQEAKDVIGRTPGSIVAVRPLKDGVIADFDITASMLQIFIKKVFNNSVLARPRIIICIPSSDDRFVYKSENTFSLTFRTANPIILPLSLEIMFLLKETPLLKSFESAS